MSNKTLEFLVAAAMITLVVCIGIAATWPFWVALAAIIYIFQ